MPTSREDAPHRGHHCGRTTVDRRNIGRRSDGRVGRNSSCGDWSRTAVVDCFLGTRLRTLAEISEISSDATSQAISELRPHVGIDVGATRTALSASRGAACISGPAAGPMNAVHEQRLFKILDIVRQADCGGRQTQPRSPPRGVRWQGTFRPSGCRGRSRRPERGSDATRQTGVWKLGELDAHARAERDTASTPRA